MPFTVKSKTLKAALTWNEMSTGRNIQVCALTQVSCPTHPQWISHHTVLGGALGLQSLNWLGSCASYAATHLDWAIYRRLCEDMSLKKKSTDLVRSNSGNGTFLDSEHRVGLTLASIACVKPWAIPGAHCRVYTGHGGRVDLRVFTGLLEVCQVVLYVT